MMKKHNSSKKLSKLIPTLTTLQMVLMSSCSMINSPKQESSERFLKPKRFLVKEGTVVYNNEEAFTLPENTNVVTLETHTEEVTRILLQGD